MLRAAAACAAALVAAAFAVLNPSGRSLLDAADGVTFLGTVGGHGPASMYASGLDASPLGDSVVVADTGNSRILKYSLDGELLWSTGTWGSGPGQFNMPRDVALDSQGFIYVADMQNGRVQKLDPAGNFVSLWKGDQATNSTLGIPMGIEVDSQDMVWVVDTGRDRVLAFDTAGNFVGPIIDGTVGPGTFDGPRDVTADTDAVYVTDTLNDRIQKFDRAGQYLQTWSGQPPDFGFPYGVVADGSGHVYALESGRGRVDVFDTNGALIVSFGTRGNGSGELAAPRRVAVEPGGRIYVADMWGYKVESWAAIDFANPVPPAHLQTWGGTPPTPGMFTEARDVAVDPSGLIYGLDRVAQHVEKFTSFESNPPGQFLLEWGGRGGGEALGWPEGIAADLDGNVFVADTNQDAIEAFQPDGTFIRQYGGAPGSGPGQFKGPMGMTFDPDGYLLVADTNNDRVQKIDPATGEALLVMGTAGSGDGQLKQPSDVALDASGNIYVADKNNHRIVRFSSAGVWQMNIGLGRGAGPGQLKNPRSVVVAPWGDVVVADTLNHRLSVFDSAGAFKYTYGTLGSNNASFNGPSGLAFDAAGRLYVADDYNGRIQVLSFLTPDPGFVTFADVTSSAGVADSYHSWGIQWADYDNDGDPDLFSGHHSGWPVLYRNNHSAGSDTFTNVTSTAGLIRRTNRLGCAWGDFNGDGLQDLHCATGGQSMPNELWKNNGDGTFSEIAAAAGIDVPFDVGRSTNWIDYNRDGWLDLFVGNSVKTGFPNRLFRNNGDGTFTDASAASGLGVSINTQASAWSDCDNDGWPDLLLAVANSAKRSAVLYRNNGNGTFSDVTGASGLTQGGAVSIAWGDYDNDGLVDVYLASKSLGASRLFRNAGGCTFTREGNANVGALHAKDATWADFDADGDLDLFVTNKVDPATQVNEPDNLYRNDGGGAFTDVAALAGVQGPTTGRGDSVAWADYDRDGDLDILVTNGRDPAVGPNVLYQNAGNANHWLELRLVNSSGAPAYGARVAVTAAGKTQHRQFTDGVGAYGQSDQIVHLGLGGTESADEVTIQWPNGALEHLTNVAADQMLTLSQP